VKNMEQNACKMFSNTRWSVVGLKTRSHKMTPVAEVTHVQ